MFIYELKYTEQWNERLQSNCFICQAGETLHKGHKRLSRSKGRALAHRWVYEREYGSIPNGLIICHKCDVPACINPNHLYAGTYADNARDRDERNPTSNAWVNRGLSEYCKRGIHKLRDEPNNIRWGTDGPRCEPCRKANRKY